MTGAATGLDRSTAMLEVTRHRAAEERLAFVCWQDLLANPLVESAESRSSLCSDGHREARQAPFGHPVRQAPGREPAGPEPLDRLGG